MLGKTSFYLVVVTLLFPPGVCPCRLAAMVAPAVVAEEAEDDAQPSSPACPCSCIQKTIDKLTSAGAEKLPAPDHLVGLLALSGPEAFGAECGPAPSHPIYRTGHTPLYLILRALRI